MSAKNQDKYPFLKSLNLQDVNPGVSDKNGLKAGSGKVHPSFSPSTGEVIASTHRDKRWGHAAVFEANWFSEYQI